MGGPRAIAALALLLVLLHVAVATADDADLDPAEADSASAVWQEEVEGQRSWLGRLVHRFFGRAPQTGDVAEGRSEQTVAPFTRYEGRRIEVVIVSPVLRFEEASVDSGAAWLGSLADKLQSYTRERVIRNQLLFRRGEPLDPYDLADSERLLRELEFINDARIVVLPLGDPDEGVALVVEYRDRWPFGVRGKIKDADRFEVGVYSTNVAGWGVRLDNNLVLNRARQPRWGYDGRLAKRNLGGTFVDAQLEYEDTWRALTRGGRLDREARHPGIRYVGGAGWQGSTVRDNGGVPLRYEDTDLWLGRVIPVTTSRGRGSGMRRILTPAASFGRRLHLDRPEVRPDTNAFYHDRRVYLAGVTYQKRTDIKTSYLFRMGEAEDVPAGMTIKAATGYEDGEFHRRTPVSVRAVGLLARERGDFLQGTFAWGGFWRERRFEDGVFDADLVYITALRGGDRYRYRLYARANYTLGIRRREADGLELADRTGVRGLAGGEVRGDQRVLARLEWRTFTPWRLFGFRIMTFLYGDTGAMAGAQDPVFQQKFYFSAGAGLRFYNPDLVLPAVEVRLGALQLVDSSAVGLAFDLGNARDPRVGAPGVRPELVSYR